MVNVTALKIRNLELGITAKDWAECLGISTALAYKKIRGKSGLSLEQADKIQKLLQISDSDFGYYFMNRSRNSQQAG